MPLVDNNIAKCSGNLIPQPSAIATELGKSNERWNMLHGQYHKTNATEEVRYNAETEKCQIHKNLAKVHTNLHYKELSVCQI
jgi:hypothetical protein